MNIEQVPSPNHWAGRFGHKVSPIVDHIMAGTLVGTDAWFRNTASQVSAHFGVGKDGSVHQYVQLADAAWSQGGYDRPHTDFYANGQVVAWWKAGQNGNLGAVSIEHEGYPGDVMPEAQYQASLAVHRFIMRGRWFGSVWKPSRRRSTTRRTGCPATSSSTA